MDARPVGQIPIPAGSGLLCPPIARKESDELASRVGVVVVPAGMALPSSSRWVYEFYREQMDVLRWWVLRAKWAVWRRVSILIQKPALSLPVWRWHIGRWCALRILEFRMFLCKLSVFLRFLFLRINVCLHLFPKRVKLVAKFGLNWRLRVLDNEVVEFLQLERDVHGLSWRIGK
jgi:hypothetical protein